MIFPDDRSRDVDATIAEGATAVRAAAISRSGDSSADASTTALLVGSVIAGRYEIVRVLGEGGMGTVYEAQDRELDRVVALKTIRSEMAASPAMLARFKQEVVLASHITHRNVVRLYDIGEDAGLKFITMEYIEGEDLRSLLLQKGKFSPKEAVEVIRQVCLALEAAHREGVIHRDLKPQNIMRDKDGRIVVMDFGLARTLEKSGMTQSGAFIGTLEYMSPEQAMGADIDGRSDLFALGLIFYELLIGNIPYKADSAIASLMKRSTERAVPASDVDASIPRTLSNVVAKCLERDRDTRYQNAAGLVADLDAFTGVTPSRVMAGRTPHRIARTTMWIVTAALVLVAAVVGYFIVRRQSQAAPTVAAGPVISLAVLPLRNSSGDPSLDWLGSSVAEMLTTDVGQSSRVRVVSSDRVHQVLRDLRISTASADDATLRRLAQFSKADQFVWGDYARFGNEIRISAKLQDVQQQRIVPLTVVAHGEEDVVNAVNQLAHSIQQSLALPSAAAEELKSTAFTPSTKSITALKNYDEGLQLTRHGSHLEALKQFEAATRDDPGFALAYSGLAQTQSKLGHSREAEQAARKALDLSSNLTPPEKYRIEASFARITNDNQKALAAYLNLARVAPEDCDVLLNVAGLYATSGDFQRARQNYDKVLALDPNYVDALLGLGELEISIGDPQGALDPLNRALSLAIQLDNQENKASALNSIGFSYYQLGKTDDALRNLQESLAIQRRLGDKRGIGMSLNAIGRVQELTGEQEKANSNYQEALRLRRDIADKAGIGGTLINLGNLSERRGRFDDALKYYKESLRIQQELGDQSYQGVCLNNIGGAYLDSGQFADALTYFQQALQVRQQLKTASDIGQTLHNLGETYLKTGHYEQALNYYLQAVELLRNAGDQLGAAEETNSMGLVFADQGRYLASLQAQQDALNAVKNQHERGYWLATIQASYGRALGLMGRFDEADKNLQEALAIAQEVHQDPVITQIMKFQGDVQLYRGQYAQAQQSYAQALKVASKTADHDLILISKASAAKAAVELGASQSAIPALRAYRQEADRRGLESLSAECALYLGKALLNAKNYAEAKKELETALFQSETVGLKPVLAQSHYLLAKVMRASGQASEVSQHESDARRLADDIRNEAKTDTLMKRSDLGPIYSLATH